MVAVAGKEVRGEGVSAMRARETSDVWSKHRQAARLLCLNPSSAMNWYATAPVWAVEGAQAQDETHYCAAETNSEKPHLPDGKHGFYHRMRQDAIEIWQA